VHLVCAFGATVFFWLAAFSFKGGPVHRAAGEWLRRLIYTAALTGAALAVGGIVAPAWGHPNSSGLSEAAWFETLRVHRQTMWIVLYVLLTIIAPVQHGLAVVAAGPRPARVRSKLHAGLNLACLVSTLLLLAAAVTWQRWLPLIVAPIGFAVGLRNMAYASRRSATSSEWEREHLTSTLTAGVTIHTALLVFGGPRVLGPNLPVSVEVLLWVVPAAVGGLAIAWLRARR
jgi:hypothetical protein